MADQKLPRREEGITKLWVRHLDAEPGFAFPLASPGTYCEVGAEILSRGQAVPTGDETASLLHAIYCNESTKNWPENRTVRDIMNQRWLWLYQTNIWTPKGVYVVQDPEAKGLDLPLSVPTLEKKLKGGIETKGVRFSKDGTVRFAPRGTYGIGEHTPSSLADDGFVIASCGFEGAKALAAAASVFNYKPRTFGVEEFPAGQPLVKRLSAVDDYVGGRLYLYGDGFGGNGIGYASGVLKSAPQARKV